MKYNENMSIKASIKTLHSHNPPPTKLIDKTEDFQSEKERYYTPATPLTYLKRYLLFGFLWDKTSYKHGRQLTTSSQSALDKISGSSFGQMILPIANETRSILTQTLGDRYIVYGIIGTGGFGIV